MVNASHLTKRYRDTVAVDDLSFTVAPGRITGFHGPNGVGKSTTMRMILGLDAPTSGSVTIDGVDYRHLRNPLLRTVGALPDPKAVDPKRTARDHLRWLAASNGIDRRRVDAATLRILHTVWRDLAHGAGVSCQKPAVDGHRSFAAMIARALVRRTHHHEGAVGDRPSLGA